MVDRLRVSVRELKEQIDTANLRLVTIGKACVHIMETVDQFSALLAPEIADTGSEIGSPEKKRKRDGVPQIGDAFDSKFQSGSLVINGLFNGEHSGGRSDGHKRSAVFFRVLSKTLYPVKSDLLKEFLVSRCDVREKFVQKWFRLNSELLMVKLRSRRSALTRFIKCSVISSLGGADIPPEKGNPMNLYRWLEDGRRIWQEAKAAARAAGLLYPTCVSDIVLTHAKGSDPHSEYTLAIPAAEIETSEWWITLIGIEAFFLSVLTCTFGNVSSSISVPLKKETLSGDVHVVAIDIVMQQRKIIYDRKVSGDKKSKCNQ
jgi:hypothetical protein